jgi:Carboxypeptidase regulatory-like domain
MRRLLLLALFAILPVLLGQGDRGTITGTITDPSGQVVPNVQVVVMNEGTGIKSTTITTEAGAYTIPLLMIGNYKLEARASGFKTYDHPGVAVQVGQTTRIDVQLEVGQVQEQVTVTASAALLTTDASDVSIVMNQDKFLDLPLTLGGDFRRASSFIFLSPGVSGSTWEKHVGGGQSFTDAVYLDGAAMNASPNNDAQYSPDVDAVDEFKLISNAYSAEYGHALNGVTSFTLKSGTNDFHGGVFEFFENDKLNARGFFPPVKAPTRQNEFGGTVGGPVRKNRTFFFASVESFRRRQGSTPSLQTIPIPAFLRGDLSQWTTPIYDPTTTVSDGKGGFTRSAFAGNQIPASRISPISAKIAALYPGPLFPNQLSGNYIGPLTSPLQDDHNFSVKMDHLFTSRHRAFGTFLFTDRPAIKGVAAGITGPAEDHNRQDLNSRFLRIGEDWTISPTLINHFVASFDRVVDTNRTLSLGQGWPGKLGLNGIQDDQFPTVTFNQGYSQLGDSTHYRNTETTFGALDTFSAIRGKHSLKFGVEYQRHYDNGLTLSNGAGSFGFSNLETALPGSGSTGNAIASFLLGEVDSATALFYSAELGVRWNYVAAYFQDDLKFTSKLTLNLGVRWDLQTPYTDPFHRLSYMDPSLPNPGAGSLPGAYVFAGSGPNAFGSSIGDTHWKDFAPRVGFAYNVAKNWVVRSGYGLFYYGIMDRTSLGIPANGFNTSASFSSPNAGVTSAFNWNGGFPQNFPHPPIISPTVQNSQGAQMNIRSWDGTWPYSQQWNFTVERQFGSSFAIRTSYVGVKGTHLDAGDATSWNQVNPQYLSLGSILGANITSPQAQAAGFKEPFPGFSDLWGSRATVAQALRPFPQFTTVSQFNPTYGSSIYHSFQLFAQKQMKHGVQFTTAYTFSKAIDNTRGYGSGVGQQNYDDRRSERSLSAVDQPQILTFSYLYELPFGNGRRYLAKGAAGKIVGGWTFSGIQSYGSGTPLSLSVVNTLPIFNGLLRPNVVSGIPQRGTIGSGGFDPGRDFWINQAAFVAPAPFTFGNAGRYINLRGPASLSESFAILKNTFMTERMRLQFRAEFANPFNRVVFSSPDTNLSSTTFGRILSQSNSPRNLQLGLKLNF